MTTNTPTPATGPVMFADDGSELVKLAIGEAALCLHGVGPIESLSGSRRLAWASPLTR
jgi:hypothetical protein